MSATSPTRRGRTVAPPAPRATLPPRAVTAPGTIALTPQGRATLDERLRTLRDVSLRRLRPLLAVHERDERDVAEFERLYAEAIWLERVLGTSVTLSPNDCSRVELGNRVLIEMPGGEQVWVRSVHPVEAFLDEERISSDSPLSRALLGARCGDLVQVHAPSGPWDCRILEVRSVEDGLVGALP